MSLMPLGLLSQGNGAGAGGNALTLISTTYGTGSSSSFTFSSIPSTYKHLQIRYAVIGASDYGSGNLRFNNDSATNYSDHYLKGDASSLASGAGTTASRIRITGPSTNILSTVPYTGIIDILDYANTNKYKTTRTLCGTNGGTYKELGLWSGSWRDTSAISSITIYTDFNLTTASRISLYGVS